MGNNGSGQEPVEVALDKALDKAFPGSKTTLSTLERENAIIAEAATRMGEHQLGVLQRAMTAVEEDAHYRQILKTAYWDNPRQKFLTSAALAECRRIGDDEGIKMILDVITAMQAGEKGGLLHDIFEALTHTTFTTNYQKQAHWWNKNNGQQKNNSPIPD